MSGPEPRERGEFQQALVEAGHVIPTGVPGVIGRSAAFEGIVAGLSTALRGRLDPQEEVEGLAFPPVVPQPVFELTDYVTSFPQLIGSLRVFTGDNADHARLLGVRQEGADWTSELSSAGLMMVSAACHPIYAMLSGTTVERPRRFDVIGQCFRHEPSDEPTRLVCFRMHEQVLVGPADAATEHRDRWLKEMEALLSGLGLEVRTEVANDPFFGRAGRIMSSGQREEALKFEIVTDIIDAGPTAIASGNAHRDHFGVNFAITGPDGESAHSACFGLGLERTTMALLHTHGLNVDSWPSEVRAQLGV